MDNVYAIRGTVQGTWPGAGLTVTNAYSGYFDLPNIGTNRAAIYAYGAKIRTMAAASQRYHWLTLSNSEGAETFKSFRVNGSSALELVNAAGDTVIQTTADDGTFTVGPTAGPLTAQIGILEPDRKADFLAESVATNTNGGGSAGIQFTIKAGVGQGSNAMLRLKNAADAVVVSVDLSGQITSTLATGTAPFSIASTTKVANLNVDQLDDKDSATAGTASTIAARDASGRLTAKRFIADGTALVAGDFALDANWGVGAAVSAVTGTDQAWQITVTAAGVPGLNPTVTLTFKDGTWTNAPICISKINGGTGAIVDLVDAPTATTNVITFNGTPVAGLTYDFTSICIGR